MCLLQRFSHMQSERGPCDPLCHLGPILTRPQPEDGASFRQQPLSCSPHLGGSCWRVHVVKLTINLPNGVYVLTKKRHNHI